MLIGICMEVHRQLGHGFLEIVYKDAIEWELRQKGISYERERPFEIDYKGTTLPHLFYADFVVLDEIILEVKAADGIADEHQAQLLNYLRAAGSRVGLVVNFGRQKMEWKRMIY